jgi:hypothetical protein
VELQRHLEEALLVPGHEPEVEQDEEIDRQQDQGGQRKEPDPSFAVVDQVPR